MMAYLVTLMITVAIATLIGMALNFQWGVAGLVNFGVAGFVAIGAYGTALSAPHIGWFAGMLVAALASMGASVLLAFLSMRLSEDYLAIVTIGFGEVVRIVLLNEEGLTGGALGIANIPGPFNGLGMGQRHDLMLLVFAAALLALVFATLERLVRSPFGRILRAIRDDEVVAAALAKPVLLLRMKAFAIGGVVMGLAGSLHAFYMTYIDPAQFTTIITSYAFVAVIAGGRGSNMGLIFGSTTIMALLEATRFLKDLIPALDGAQLAALRLGGVGLGIILLLILRPQGLMAEPHTRSTTLLPETQETPDAARHPASLDGAARRGS